MAKHPVPKKKTSAARSKRRYGSFKTRVLTNLSNLIQLTDCKSCGAKKRNHHVCKECGEYNGKTVLDKTKKVKKITKIKA